MDKERVDFVRDLSEKIEDLNTIINKNQSIIEFQENKIIVLEKLLAAAISSLRSGENGGCPPECPAKQIDDQEGVFLYCKEKCLINEKIEEHWSDYLKNKVEEQMRRKNKNEIIL
jgi:hypothetical protein